MRLQAALILSIIPVTLWAIAPAPAAQTAQQRCIAQAVKSDAVHAFPQGVAKVCGVSPAAITPSTPAVGQPTEDGAQLPPAECVKELEQSDICLGDAWTPDSNN
jgi:hypothetical protein